MSRLALSLSRLADAVDASNSLPTEDGNGMKRVRNASDALTGKFSEIAENRGEQSMTSFAIQTRVSFDQLVDTFCRAVQYVKSEEFSHFDVDRVARAAGILSEKLVQREGGKPVEQPIEQR